MRWNMISVRKYHVFWCLVAKKKKLLKHVKCRTPSSSSLTWISSWKSFIIGSMSAFLPRVAHVHVFQSRLYRDVTFTWWIPHGRYPESAACAPDHPAANFEPFLIRCGVIACQRFHPLNILLCLTIGFVDVSALTAFSCESVVGLLPGKRLASIAWQEFWFLSLNQ